jgi:hypothetical protein
MIRSNSSILWAVTILGCLRPGADSDDESLETASDSSATSTDEVSSTDSNSSEVTSSEESTASEESTEDATTSDDTTSDESTDTIQDADSSEETDETGTEGTCPDGLVVHVGTVYGATNADLDPLIGVECLDGHLLLHTGLMGPLTQLSSLQIVVGSVEVAEEGPQLQSLAGLESLWWVQSDIRFNAQSLTSLDGLNGLVEVGGEFQIARGNFGNLDALANLTTVDSGFILGAPEDGAPWIEQIEGLSGLENVGGLFVYATYGLTSLSGLENLQTVGTERIEGTIQITQNQHLVDVTPIGGGAPLVIPGSLSIGDNPMLPTCNAMALADTLDVMGNIGIDNNLPDACGG